MFCTACTMTIFSFSFFQKQQNMTALFVFLSLFCAVFGTIITPSQLPLSVTSRWIVDKNGQRVKLACANWYGFDQQDYVVGGLQWQTIDEIVNQFILAGLNCVRLPFSLELIATNPTVDQQKVEAEPTLYKSHFFFFYLTAFLKKMVIHTN